MPQEDDLKITELEVFKVQPRWLFLKVHTNAGIVGLGEGDLTEPIEVDEDGYIPLPEGLGLGIELDEDQLEDKLGHDWNNTKTYDADDGSVVNW